MYLVGGQGTSALICMGAPGFLGSMLLLPQAVLSGQWLLTVLVNLPCGNPILGFAVTIAAAFLFPYSVATNVYITGSIFLAFARLYPEYEILIFVLPVKVKWLARITWLGYGYSFVTGD